jgi:uncharacterized protein YjbJ (UPF0337 family)
MNKQTVEGKFDQVAGKIKEKIGEATGNERLANAGAADQIKGAVKETWGHAKDAAREAGETARAKSDIERESLKDRVETGAHDLREKTTSTVQNVKEKVGEKLDEFKRDQQQARDDLRG